MWLAYFLDHLAGHMIRLARDNDLADFLFGVDASTLAWGVCLMEWCTGTNDHEVEVDMPAKMAVSNDYKGKI